MDSFSNRLSSLSISLEEVYNKRIISYETKLYFESIINNLVDELNEIKRESVVDDSIIISIGGEIRIIELLLSNIIINYNNKDFLMDIYEKLNGKDNDFYYVRGPVNTPRCFFNETFFFLVAPDDYDYLDVHMIGLLVHEIAHTHPFVQRYQFSMQSSKRKIGESLVDVIAYSIIEYLYSYSCIYYISQKKINIEIDCFDHPAWLVRLIIMRDVIPLLWDESIIVQRNWDLLTPIIDGKFCNTINEDLVQQINREIKYSTTQWKDICTKEHFLLEDNLEKSGFNQLYNMIGGLINEQNP